ncbi:hypothetical protein [Rubritalea sp.]|uniref:hypothetical protein n=1 Tax=Rubritalea sp. TaxID=2109375 RepID=UPI003EF709DF
MKNLLAPTVACLSLFLGGTRAHAKKVDLTNSDGKAVTVDLISFTESDIKVRLLSSSRKVVNIPLTSLSDESKALITEWKNAGGGLSRDFDVSVKVSKDTEKPKATNTGNNAKNSNKNNKSQPVMNTLQLTVTVSNGANNIPSAAAQMKVISIGRSQAKSGNYFILDIQKKGLPSLESRESKEFEMNSTSFSYVDGTKETSRGAKYSGYAVLILDGEGEVIGGKSVPSNLYDRNLENLAEVSKGRFYNSDFTPSYHSEAGKK